MIIDDPKAPYTLGGKATGLYQLLNAGIAVPAFLVIPAETFQFALKPFPLTNEQSNEQTIRERKQGLLAFSLSQQDQEDLAHRLSDWGFPSLPVVVRSSIADEDGEKDAFPGMMNSLLNLTSLPAVFDAIATCAASAYSDRSVAYRKQKGLSLDAQPAVIIQQQITPAASGVLFTTFPQYPQELAIHAVWGFGEGLVSGMLDADEFYFWKKNGDCHRKNVTNKQQQLVAQLMGGLTAATVALEKQQLPCLSEVQLKELFRIGTFLEKTFGHPQDIEFVVTNEQILLVQSRAITQPIPEVIVYDNSNIQESYCGVTTPLTFSFAQRAYATVYRQTMQTLGLPQHMIQAQENVVNNLLGLVKGRIYYNINNWYRGLQLLPSFQQNKADMERMMGLEEPVDFVQNRKKTTQQKIRLLPSLLVNLTRLVRAFSRLKTLVPAFHSRFHHHYHRFYALSLSSLDTEELVAQKQLLDRELLNNWTTPIINDFYVMMTNGKVIRKLTKAGLATPDDFLSHFLSGDQQIESTQPTKAMLKLAETARQQPQLRALILALPPDLHQQVAASFAAFHEEVKTFIDQYGDRTVGELKLETHTMRVVPFIFYKYLRNYLVTEKSFAWTEENTSLHTEAANELSLRLKTHSFLFKRSIWRNLSRLQRAIRYRESLRLERTRLFGMYRALYLAMGNQLVQNKVLSSPETVFYLTEEEIIQALNNPSEKVAHLVTTRINEFEGYKNEEVSSRITIPSPPVTASQLPETDTPGLLQGNGCFPGIATGEVIVITDPGDALDVTGKIVCALRTDPGWAALFPTCLGVLIEKGSALSHSAILLRELGLPTIINIPQLTKRLQTGQQVTMNGATGEIKSVEP